MCVYIYIIRMPEMRCKPDQDFLKLTVVAYRSIVQIIHTLAFEIINSVCARSSVFTWTAGAFVNICSKRHSLLNIKDIKLSSYIMQYPVLRTAQSALHFTSLADLFNQTSFQFISEASSHAAVNL